MQVMEVVIIGIAEKIYMTHQHGYIYILAMVLPSFPTWITEESISVINNIVWFIILKFDAQKTGYIINKHMTIISLARQPAVLQFITFNTD